jgi:zinc/manganese transport system substrate-binding protein
VPSGTTLASPSSSDLESLAGAVRDAGVPAIFVDSSHPDRLARVLADEAGVDVDVVALYSESLDEPGTKGATYLDMMRTNTEAIVTGLTSR